MVYLLRHGENLTKALLASAFIAVGALFASASQARGQDSAAVPPSALNASPRVSAQALDLHPLSIPDKSTPSKTFFTRHDLTLTAIALAGTAVVSIFDTRVAHYAQSAGVQGSTSRQTLFKNLSRLNETPFLFGSVAGYGIGRLTHSPTLAEASLHTAEALLLTSAIGQSIRGPLGRNRPSVDITDPYHFQFGKGFGHFNNRSFPSLHAATGFAVASAVSGEIHAHNPNANAFVSPLLYTVAAIPGLTRLYLNQHWASDVVAGGFLGAFMGSRVVSYAHSHNRSKLDRFLLGTSVVSNGHGGSMLSVSLDY